MLYFFFNAVSVLVSTRASRTPLGASSLAASLRIRSSEWQCAHLQDRASVASLGEGGGLCTCSPGTVEVDKHDFGFLHDVVKVAVVKVQHHVRRLGVVAESGMKAADSCYC